MRTKTLAVAGVLVKLYISRQARGLRDNLTTHINIQQDEAPSFSEGWIARNPTSIEDRRNKTCFT